MLICVCVGDQACAFFFRCVAMHMLAFACACACSVCFMDNFRCCLLFPNQINGKRLLALFIFASRSRSFSVYTGACAIGAFVFPVAHFIMLLFLVPLLFPQVFSILRTGKKKHQAVSSISV